MDAKLDYTFVAADLSARDVPDRLELKITQHPKPGSVVEILHKLFLYTPSKITKLAA